MANGIFSFRLDDAERKGHDTALREAGDIGLCFLQLVSVRSGQAVQDEERRVLEQVQGGVPEGKEQRGDEEKNIQIFVGIKALFFL